QYARSRSCSVPRMTPEKGLGGGGSLARRSVASIGESRCRSRGPLAAAGARGRVYIIRSARPRTRVRYDSRAPPEVFRVCASMRSSTGARQGGRPETNFLTLRLRATLKAKAMVPALRRATYEDVLEVAADKVAEALAGQLRLSPRSARPHTVSSRGVHWP